jgi:hypothetical protein
MQILADNGSYVTAELGGGIDSRVPGSPPAVTARGKPGEMIDGQPTNGPWQQWIEIANADGTVSFTCYSGQYLTAELGGGSTLSTDRTENGPWQRFRRVGGMLQCWNGVNYLKVRTDLGPVAVVDATGTTQGLTFRIVGDHPLAPALPFKGAFCIPNVLPGIPFGDGKRIWTPAFGCYAGTPWQDRILDAGVARGHTWFLPQISGFPYRQDYPELALDPARIAADLTKIHSRGIRTLVSFRDDQGDDLSYLQPVAAITQDLVDGIFGIFEVNGVLRDPLKVLNVLKQSRALWPKAILGVHFTDLVQSESFGLVDFTRAVNEAGLNVLFFQASGWIQSVDQVAARVADFTRRLGGPRMHGYPTLSHGVVLAELTTSRTYRDWTEAQGVAYADAVRGRPMAPDEGIMSVPVTGYLDGGTP